MNKDELREKVENKLTHLVYTDLKDLGLEIIEFLDSHDIRTEKDLLSEKFVNLYAELTEYDACNREYYRIKKELNGLLKQIQELT